MKVGEVTSDMGGQIRSWAQWVLPFAAIIMLLWGMRAQFFPAVPVAVVAVVVWLFLLPRGRSG